MKPAIYLALLLSVSFFSCSIRNTEDPNAGKEVDPKVAAMASTLLGSYVGPFGDNKITILITKVTKDSVEGRSVVAGNDRPFAGTLKEEGDQFNIAAKEPGDDEHDGSFAFHISKKSPDDLVGSWTPAKPTEKLTAKDYTLKRRSFVYMQDVGIYPQASKRELTEADLNNLSKWELEVMRNEIYARHGYCFKKKSIRDAIEKQDWYVPKSVDVRKDLTELEKKNIEMIKRYEHYEEQYGDEFGR